MSKKLVVESLNEGTWDIPGPGDESYIDELKDFQKRIYSIFGDDEVHNGLDAAISRMEELLKLRDFNKRATPYEKIGIGIGTGRK